MQYKRSVTLTQKLISEGYPVIYEAAFVHENTLVAIDILVKEKDGWVAYEVKSSLKVSETYLRDAALQYRIISQSGLPLTDMSLVYLDKAYTYTSNHDIHKLFKIKSILPEINQRRLFIERGLNTARQTLLGSEIPQVNIGPHCTTPYPCDFAGYCWKEMQQQPLFKFTSLEEDRKWELFDKGIFDLADFPADYPMTISQSAQFKVLSSNDVHIDAERIKTTLGKEIYPLAFLDIHVCRPAIPLLNESKPYQNISFLYSLLIQNSKDGDPVLKYYLPEAGADAADSLYQQLVSDLVDIKKLIVFNKDYEMKLLKASLKTYGNPNLSKLAVAATDVHEIFRQHMFCHPATGSLGEPHSVLPALGVSFPALSSSDIKSSYMAGIAFESLFSQTDLIKITETRQKLETFTQHQLAALQKIHEALTKLTA